MLGIAHAIAKRLELGLGDRRLDQREDLVLLEADVVCESRTEVVEQLSGGVPASRAASRRISMWSRSMRMIAGWSGSP